jgi:hypothetical protein
MQQDTFEEEQYFFLIAEFFYKIYKILILTVDIEQKTKSFTWKEYCAGSFVPMMKLLWVK